MRRHYFGLALATLIVAGCDSILGTSEEMEYEGNLAVTFLHTELGRVTCVRRYNASGMIWLKLQIEGDQVTGKGEINWEDHLAGLASGDPEFCRGGHHHGLARSFRADPGEVKGSRTDIRWSKATSEASSRSTLSFTGGILNDVLSGTLTYSRSETIPSPGSASWSTAVTLTPR